MCLYAACISHPGSLLPLLSVRLCSSHFNGLMVEDEQMSVMLCEFVFMCVLQYLLNPVLHCFSLKQQRVGGHYACLCLQYVWFIFFYVGTYGINAAYLIFGELLMITVAL